VEEVFSIFIKFIQENAPVKQVRQINLWTLLSGQRKELDNQRGLSFPIRDKFLFLERKALDRNVWFG